MHIAYALRRAWSHPLRSLFALAACALAWMALFQAEAEIANLNRDAARAGWLGGAQGYQISVKKEHQEGAARRTVALPRAFVERARQTAQASVIQLTRSISAISPDRLNATPAKLLFYDEGLGAQTTRYSTFPPCALSQAAGQWRQQNLLMPLANGWRCYLSAFPPSLTILKNNYDGDSIAFPLSALKEIAGRSALDEVEIMWLAIADRQKLDQLLYWAIGTLKLDLEVQPLGGILNAQTAALSAITQLWLSAAAGMLLIGIGLYVHGVYAEMRREAGLRACLGMPFAHLARWLTTDILTQALTLTWLSAAFGWGSYFFLSPQIDMAATFQRIGLVSGILALLFGVISISLAWQVMRQNRMVMMIRG